MIHVGFLREIKQRSYQLTIDVKDSTELPIEIFLFRKDIDNQPIYVNVCSIDDIQKYNPSTPIIYTASIQEKTFTSIQALEDYKSDVESKIRLLERDYIKFLNEHKFGSEEIVTIDESWNS